MPGEGLSYELGIIDEAQQIVPRSARGLFAGGYLTLVVDDVHAAHERAKAMDIDVVSVPTPLDYGQTQMVVRDPNSVVVDISSPTP